MKLKTIIIGIVVVAVIGGIVFLAKGKRSEPSESSATATPENTADFSMRYPDNYKVYHSSASSDEQITTIENADGRGFQISVTPFDEPGPITAERIRQDEPDAVINNPGAAKLDGELSFVFYGKDPDLGDTFEVWTVHGGKLYQIMGIKADEQLISDAINTWKWR